MAGQSRIPSASAPHQGMAPTNGLIDGVDLRLAHRRIQLRLKEHRDESKKEEPTPDPADRI